MKREQKAKVAAVVLIGVMSFGVTGFAQAPHDNKNDGKTDTSSGRPAGAEAYKLPDQYAGLRKLITDRKELSMAAPIQLSGQGATDRQIDISATDKKQPVLSFLDAVEKARKTFFDCDKQSDSVKALLPLVDSFVKYLHDRSVVENPPSFDARIAMSYIEVLKHALTERNKRFDAKATELPKDEKALLDQMRGALAVFVPNLTEEEKNPLWNPKLVSSSATAGASSASAFSAAGLDAAVVTEFENLKFFEKLAEQEKKGATEYCKLGDSGPLTPAGPASAANTNLNKEVVAGIPGAGPGFGEDEPAEEEGTPGGGAGQKLEDAAQQAVAGLKPQLDSLTAQQSQLANALNQIPALLDQNRQQDLLARNLLDDPDRRRQDLEALAALRPNEAPSGNTGGDRSNVESPTQIPPISPQFPSSGNSNQPQLDPNAGLANQPQPQPFNPAAMIPPSQPQALPVPIPQLGQNLNNDDRRRETPAPLNVAEEVQKAMAPMWSMMNQMMGGYPQQAVNGARNLYNRGLTYFNGARGRNSSASGTGRSGTPARLQGAQRANSNGNQNVAGRSSRTPSRLTLGR